MAVPRCVGAHIPKHSTCNSGWYAIKDARRSPRDDDGLNIFDSSCTERKDTREDVWNESNQRSTRDFCSISYLLRSNLIYSMIEKLITVVQ